MKLFQKTSKNEVKQAQRGQVKTCQICQEVFSKIKLREHQCKRCLRAICKYCGKQKSPIYTYENITKEKHRICTLCKQDSDFITEFIKDFKIEALQPSQHSVDWKKSLEIEDKKNHKDYLYYNTLKNVLAESEKSQYKQFNENHQNLIQQAFFQFNYSLIEFISLVTQNVKMKDFEAEIEKVYTALLIKHKDIGYCDSFLQLTIIILCFSTPADAFLIISHILESILSSDFYPIVIKQKGFTPKLYSEKIIKIIKMFNQDEQYLKNVKKFLEIPFFIQIVQSFGINIMKFPNFFLTFDKIILKKNSDIIMQALSCVLYLNEEQFLSEFSSENLSTIQLGIINQTQYKEMNELQETFIEAVQKYKDEQEKEAETQILVNKIKQDQQVQQINSRYTAYIENNSNYLTSTEFKEIFKNEQDSLLIVQEQFSQSSENQNSQQDLEAELENTNEKRNQKLKKLNTKSMVGEQKIYQVNDQAKQISYDDLELQQKKFDKNENKNSDQKILIKEQQEEKTNLPINQDIQEHQRVNQSSLLERPSVTVQKIEEKQQDLKEFKSDNDEIKDKNIEKLKKIKKKKKKTNTQNNQDLKVKEEEFKKLQFEIEIMKKNLKEKSQQSTDYSSISISDLQSDYINSKNINFKYQQNKEDSKSYWLHCKFCNIQ